MKGIILTLTCIILVGTISTQAQQNAEVLTNETVTMLHKKGLGQAIIINKIKNSNTKFDVSTDALIKLKEDSIPDEIVAVMVESSGKKEPVTIDLSNPLSLHPSGIYYYNPKDETKPLMRLDPTVVSVNKSGGFGTVLAQRYTFGLANNKSISSISGANARKQLKDNNPVFYFYFDKSGSNLNQTNNWWFMTATSPNEFALVHLYQKENSRELEVGKNNAYSQSTGVSESQKVAFDYTEVAENIYKVTIRGKIKEGEYSFIFTGATPSIYSNNKVFDFGIF